MKIFLRKLYNLWTYPKCHCHHEFAFDCDCFGTGETQVSCSCCKKEDCEVCHQPHDKKHFNKEEFIKQAEAIQKEEEK